MANPYFRNIPDFEYVSRNKGEQYISNYTTVKNLFKKAKLREDIFGNVIFFEKYSIIGDERPDNVAYKFYDDETLDWIILLSNNILNIQSEWPIPQVVFDRFLIDKYKIDGEDEEETYNRIYNGIHHYESPEIKNTSGVTILKEGLKIPENFSFSYYDPLLGINETKSNFAVPITNFEFENELQNKKRDIFILKPIYLNIVFNDLDEIMPYKEGSGQYISRTLKRGDNIRLYS